jgi:hypothetical protein
MGGHLSGRARLLQLTSKIGEIGMEELFDEGTGRKGEEAVERGGIG